jgi:hypothetical protein
MPTAILERPTHLIEEAPVAGLLAPGEDLPLPSSDQRILHLGDAATVEARQKAPEQLRKPPTIEEVSLNILSATRGEMHKDNTIRSLNKEAAQTEINKQHGRMEAVKATLRALINPEDRDKALNKAFSNIRDPQESFYFDRVVTGIANEILAEDAAREIVEKNKGWGIRPATAEEDIQEGADFFVTLPNELGEIAFDAKSPDKLKRLTGQNSTWCQVRRVNDWLSLKKMKKVDDLDEMRILISVGQADESGIAQHVRLDNEHGQTAIVPSFGIKPGVIPVGLDSSLSAIIQHIENTRRGAREHATAA